MKADDFRLTLAAGGRWICWIVLATVPLLFGAVQAWVWSVYVVGVYGAYIISLQLTGKEGEKQFAVDGLQLTGKEGGQSSRKGWTGKPGVGVLGFLLCWVGLQVVPLPVGVVRLISPLRARWVTEAGRIIGEPAGWTTIGFAPLDSLAKLALGVALVLFYLVLKDNLKSTRRVRTFLVIVVVLGLFEAFYGLVQTLVPAVGVLWVDSAFAYLGTARGTYINRNHFAGFMEMVIALTLAHALAVGYWPVQGKLRRVLASDHLNKVVFWGIMLVVMLIALFFSQSRAGIMCGMVGAFCVFVFNRRAGRKKSRTVVLLVGAMVTLFLIYGFTIGFQPIFDRFLRLGSQSASRMDIWKDSWKIVKDYPLGVGLGNFDKVYRVYHVQASPEVRFVYAHNDYLQVLIETGWPGFVVLVGGFLAFMGSRVRRVWRLDPKTDPQRFYMGAGAIAGLVAIGLHSFVDFNLQIPANALYFAALMAVVDAVTDPVFQTDPEYRTGSVSRRRRKKKPGVPG